MWWMHATGMLDECHDQVDDLRRVRALPSPQLIGTPEKVTLDLNVLADRGVELVGRVAGLQGNRLQFSGSLANVVRLADLKLGRLLTAFDQWAEVEGLGKALEMATRPEPTTLPRHPRLELDLGTGEISTVIWATGFRPDYDWLQVPVLDHKGWIRHRGGVADAPGLYVMGLPFMRKRKSSFLFGCEDDARFVADHITLYLAGCQPGQGRAVA